MIQLGLAGGTAGAFYFMKVDAEDYATGQEDGSGPYGGLLNPESDALKDQLEADHALKQKRALWGGIVAGVLCLSFFVCLCAFRKDLASAIDVIDASSDYLKQNFIIVGIVLFHFVLTIVAVAVWAAAMACVVGMNEILPDKDIP